MGFTRIKKKTNTIKNGVYKGSILNIVQSSQEVKITFITPLGQIGLELPINEKTLLKLSQIAYLGGLNEKEDVLLSSLVNLRFTLHISGGKISKITKY